MRTRIKVMDLSLTQWDYLTTKVPVDGREFLAGIPRACVEFELTPDFNTLHIEMDLVELAGLTVTLAAMDIKDVARAALTPDALPVLPAPDEVHDLSAKDAAALARQMNSES